jgi:hypothetical protein
MAKVTTSYEYNVNFIRGMRRDKMIVWNIILGILLYISIGIGVLIYIVKTDKYGGLVLEIAPLVVLGYPYLIVRSLFK